MYPSYLINMSVIAPRIGALEMGPKHEMAQITLVKF
jgi:hypothetical protein